MSLLKKIYYAPLISLSLAPCTVFAKKIIFNDLLSQSWEYQTDAKTLASSQNILDVLKKNTNTIFKQRPNLEINSVLSSEKEYQIKTNFEFKNTNQKIIDSTVIDNEYLILSLKNAQSKLDFAQLLENISWQFILFQQQLQHCNKQLETNLEFKKLIFKQYQTGLISYIQFKLLEVDILDFQQKCRNIEYDLQDNLIVLNNISNYIINNNINNINVNDVIEIKNDEAVNSIFNAQGVIKNINNTDNINNTFNIEQHPSYQYQKSIIQRSILQKNYINNQPKYPIIGSIGTGIKSQNKTSYQISLGIQIPLDKQYEIIQKNAEISKNLIESENNYLIFKKQLNSQVNQTINMINKYHEILKITEQAIKTQTDILAIYYKAVVAGEVDLAVYLKNKRDFFSLEQQLIKNKIDLQQAQRALLYNMGLFKY